MRNDAVANPNQVMAEADALETQGRVDEAEALYRRLLGAYPGQPAVLHRLALLLKGRGALSEAESSLRRALMAAPNEPVLHNNLGNVLRAAMRFADAEACYRKAIGFNPKYAEAHYNLGAVLEDQARPDEALESYRSASALRPGYAQAQTRIGAILRDKGELDEALAALGIAVTAEPDSFEANYYRGLALAGLERHVEAAEALALATTLRTTSLEALIALANNLNAAGRHDDAISALWRAMELQPMVVATHEEINRLSWMAGRKDMLFKSFNYVRERFGDDPGLLFSEAQIRMQRIDPLGAEPLLRKALAIAPERSDASALLGRLLARRGHYDESFEAFQNSVRFDPTMPAYRNEFGYALLLGSEPKKAIEQFEAARAANPVDQLALGGMCLAYRMLGDSRYHELVDLDRFVRVYPLPLPSGYADVLSYNATLAEELLKLHTLTAEPLEQTLRGGTQTAGLLFSRKSKIIDQLREQISEAVTSYVREMPDASNHPLSSRKQEQFSFTHSWSCKLRSSGFHTNHVHPMGWISSAYYVSLPDALEDEGKKQGWLKFCESHLLMGGDDRAEHFVRPRVGTLVLFPSYFWHGTVPFESNADRLTVAFDVVPGIVDANSIPARPY